MSSLLLTTRLNLVNASTFFQLSFDKIIHTVVVISKFSPPDMQLLQESHYMIYTCHYQSDSTLVACNINCIKMLVAMVPYFKVVPVSGEINLLPMEHLLGHIC